MRNLVPIIFLTFSSFVFGETLSFNCPNGIFSVRGVSQSLISSSEVIFNKDKGYALFNINLGRYENSILVEIDEGPIVRNNKIFFYGNLIKPDREKLNDILISVEELNDSEFDLKLMIGKEVNDFDEALYQSSYGLYCKSRELL